MFLLVWEAFVEFVKKRLVGGGGGRGGGVITEYCVLMFSLTHLKMGVNSGGGFWFAFLSFLLK